MGTHPIFESDFDCLTDKCKCGLSDSICLTKFDFNPTNIPPPIKLKLVRNKEGNTYSINKLNNTNNNQIQQQIPGGTNHGTKPEVPIEKTERNRKRFGFEMETEVEVQKKKRKIEK